MGQATYIATAADAAVDRYGDRAPEALRELITAAIELDEADLAADFDRIFRRVEQQLAAGVTTPP